jgi:hypothetical protein
VKRKDDNGIPILRERSFKGFTVHKKVMIKKEKEKGINASLCADREKMILFWSTS